MRETLAADQAFGIAARFPLPLKARSRTLAEMRRREAIRGAILWLIPAAFCGFVIAMLSAEEGTAYRSALTVLVPICLVLLALLGLYVWWRLRRIAAYQNPLIALEVSDRGITLERRGFRYALPVSGLRYAIDYQSVRSHVQFLGIRLESPIGTIHVTEQGYRGGLKLAAAVVAEHDRWRKLHGLN